MHKKKIRGKLFNFLVISNVSLPFSGRKIEKVGSKTQKPRLPNADHLSNLFSFVGSLPRVERRLIINKLASYYQIGCALH